MTSKNTRRALLAELRAMTDRGEVRRGEPLTEDDRLPAVFWAEAEVVAPPKTSVHLELDREVLPALQADGSSEEAATSVK